MYLPATLSRRCSAMLKVILKDIGASEALLLCALTLVTVGLWPIAERYFDAGRVALLVPGLVGLWLGLPERRPLVERAKQPARITRRQQVNLKVGERTD